MDLALKSGVQEQVDLLVCADGIGSRSRRTLQPEVAPAYAGYVAWRGMVPEQALPDATVAALADAITYFVYANGHIPAGRRPRDVLTDVSGACRDTSLPPGPARPEHVAELRATAAARLPGAIAAVVTASDAPFLQVVMDVELEHMKAVPRSRPSRDRRRLAVPAGSQEAVGPDPGRLPGRRRGRCRPDRHRKGVVRLKALLDTQ